MRAKWNQLQTWNSTEMAHIACNHGRIENESGRSYDEIVELQALAVQLQFRIQIAGTKRNFDGHWNRCYRRNHVCNEPFPASHLLRSRCTSDPMLQFSKSNHRNRDRVRFVEASQQIVHREPRPLRENKFRSIEDQSHFDESSDSGCRSRKLRTSRANSSSITPRSPGSEARIARASPTVIMRGFGTCLLYTSDAADD